MRSSLGVGSRMSRPAVQRVTVALISMSSWLEQRFRIAERIGVVIG
jgi:hypothetical protein